MGVECSNYNPPCQQVSATVLLSCGVGATGGDIERHLESQAHLSACSPLPSTLPSLVLFICMCLSPCFLAVLFVCSLLSVRHSFFSSILTSFLACWLVLLSNYPPLLSLHFSLVPSSCFFSCFIVQRTPLLFEY